MKQFNYGLCNSMTKVLALAPAHRASSLHSPTLCPVSGMEAGFMMQKKRWPHTHWDASVFYSLRQHLLCVITPSPTQFTPYILSSSHLPHLYLPLCRPLPPSRSFFSLFPSHHFLSLFPPAFLPIFIPPSTLSPSSSPPQQLARGAVEQIALGISLSVLSL